MILDLYAGGGGWDEGARLAGHGPVLGLDNWLDACRTGHAAGHARICADAATYPTAPFAGRVTGLLGAPPCQPWSAAGNRVGEHDRTRVHQLVDRYATADPTAERAWTEAGWADPRSHHAAQPVRWIRDLRPDWVCLEQVKEVLPLWRHIGRVLAGWGYHVWVGKLNAADYAVPQTRVRAFLAASRLRRVVPPTPTHYDPRRGTAMLGRPWVSMAEALGWGPDGRPSWTVSGGGTGSGGGVEVFGAHARAEMLSYRNGNRERSDGRPLAMPAPTVHFGNNHTKVEWVVRTNTNSEQGGGQLVPYERGVDQPAPTVRSTTSRWVVRTSYGTPTGDRCGTHELDPADRPAHTVTSKTRSWTVGRPATTVMGDSRVEAPGHHGDRSGDDRHADSIKVSLVEAAVLQGFRADYPWRGAETAQYTQVGNAVPPPLAAAVIGAAAGGRASELAA